MSTTETAAETTELIRTYAAWEQADREHRAALTARRNTQAAYRNDPTPERAEAYKWAKYNSCRLSRIATAAYTAHTRAQLANETQTQPEQQQEAAAAYTTQTQPLIPPYHEEQTMHPYAPAAGHAIAYTIASSHPEEDLDAPTQAAIYAQNAQSRATEAAHDADRHAGQAEEHRHYAQQAATEAAAEADRAERSADDVATRGLKVIEAAETAEQAAAAAQVSDAAAERHATEAAESNAEAAGHANKAEQSELAAQAAEEESTEQAGRARRRSVEAEEAAEEADRHAQDADANARAARESADAAEEQADRAEARATAAAESAEEAQTARDAASASATSAALSDESAEELRDEAREAAMSASAASLEAHAARSQTADDADTAHSAAQESRAARADAGAHATHAATDADRAEAARNEARMYRDQAATILEQIRSLAANGTPTPAIVAAYTPRDDAGLPDTTAEQIRGYLSRAIRTYWAEGPSPDYDDERPADEPEIGTFNYTHTDPTNQITLMEHSTDLDNDAERLWIITITRAPDEPAAPASPATTAAANAIAAACQEAKAYADAGETYYGAAIDDAAIRAATAAYKAQITKTIPDYDRATHAAHEAAIETGLDPNRADALARAIDTYADLQAEEEHDAATNAALWTYHTTPGEYETDDAEYERVTAEEADAAAQAAYDRARNDGWHASAAWDAARDAGHAIGLDKHDATTAADRADARWQADNDATPAGQGIAAARAETLAGEAIQAAYLARRERELADRRDTLAYLAREAANRPRSMTEEESTQLQDAAAAVVAAETLLAATRCAYGLPA